MCNDSNENNECGFNNQQTGNDELLFDYKTITGKDTEILKQKITKNQQLLDKLIATAQC